MSFIHKLNKLPEIKSPCVVNLSSKPLTDTQNSLLSKGLNFCPTPGEPNTGEIRKDFDKFHCSLRRKFFFSKEVNNDPQDTQSDIDIPDDPLQLDIPFKNPKFKNASTWSPIGAPNLEAMITCNERSLTKFIPRDPISHNLSKQEKQALAELKSNGDITIKSADKGSAVVIMNTADYISEGIRQLSDSKFYKEVDTDLTDEHNNYVYEI